MWTTWARRLGLKCLGLKRLGRYLTRGFRSAPRLTPAQQRILTALVEGAHLKSHRTADGHKDYRLHRADGSIFHAVAAADVHRLRDAGLIVGNMKFPAATYLLTSAGLEQANELTTDHPTHPITPRG